MMALLLKDYFVIRRLLLFYLVMVLAFQAMPGTGAVFLVLYPALLPASAFAYDDRSRWGELAAMMPYSETQIILSRYALGWIAIAVFALLGQAARVVCGRFLPVLGQSVGGMTDLPTFVILLSVSLLFLDLSLPLYFRYDAEKSRIVRMLLVSLVCGVVGAGFAALGLSAWDFTDGGFTWADWTVWLLPLSVVPLTALSIYLSKLAYRARLKRA